MTGTYRLPTLADHAVAWLNLGTFRRMTRGARLAARFNAPQFPEVAS